MSENTKKIGLILVIIVAVTGAVFGGMRLFGEDKMEVQNTVKMPENFKSEKQRALEEQAGGTGGKGAERDLGG